MENKTYSSDCSNCGKSIAVTTIIGDSHRKVKLCGACCKGLKHTDVIRTKVAIGCIYLWLLTKKWSIK